MPTILFMDMACTTRSYTIDVFLSGAASLEADPARNPDYIGRITRLGMGPTGSRTPRSNGAGGGTRGTRRNSTNRCNKPGLTCSLPCPEHVVDRIPPGGKLGAKHAVTDLGRGEVVDESEWSQRKGLQPLVVELVEV